MKALPARGTVPRREMARKLSSPLRQFSLLNEGSLLCVLDGRVDPDGWWECVGDRRSVEALRVSLVSGVEGFCSLFEDLLGAIEVDICRCQQGDAGVPVLVVVPTEEASAEGSGLLQRGETVRERRAVLEGLELCLGERVVVAGMRAAVALGDIELSEQLSHRLGRHTSAAVSVQSQLPWRDRVLDDALADEDR